MLTKKINVLFPLVLASMVFALGFAVESLADAHSDRTAVIYAATNKADGNTLVGFRGSADGKYERIGEFGTGGTGTGDLEIPALQKDETHPLANGDDPLISANGITATDDGKHVLAVNAGDATIGLLKVNSDGSLKLVNTAKASDKFPVSVASTGRNVVVASVGVDNNHGSIGAYVINGAGKLVAVENSRRDLQARPSTVAFTRDGKHLIVNELVTGKVKVFALEGSTLSAEPVSMVDSPRAEGRFQAIPVGFDVGTGDDGDLILMSEARFLTPEFGLREEANVVPQTPKYSWQTGSLSSYVVDSKGRIRLVSGDVMTGDKVEGGEIANCWVVLSPDQRTLWAANALSSSISSFDIDRDGTASLKNVTAFKSDPELLFFSDMAVSVDGRNLFQLVGNRGEIMVFDIDRNGDLSLNQTLKGLPKLGAYGILVL